MYLLVSVAFLLPCIVRANPPHNWHSHTEVQRKVTDLYKKMHSYQADFQIQTPKRTMTGKASYLDEGTVRFDFSNPAGDMLLSDGKVLWIVISRMGIVGRQDLTIDQKDENGNRIFAVMPGKGIDRLFKKYHYRFDGLDQPRKVDGTDYFVLFLEQKEKIGGYSQMTLYINAKTYLIEKAEAVDSLDGKTTIQFRNIRPDAPVDGSLFQYSPPDTKRVVYNPLVSDE